MMSIRVNTNSLANMVGRLETVKHAVLQGGFEGVQQVADDILGKVLDTVPIDTGATRDSAYKDSEITDTQVRFVIGHGGVAARTNPKTQKSTDSYSVSLHEMGDEKLNPRNLEEGRTTKWLEKAVIASEETFDQVVASHIKGRVGL